MGVLIVRLVQIIANAPPIEAVRLEDGRLGATLKSLCILLGIARHSQLMRIRRNPSLAPSLVLVALPTNGGPQVVDVILSGALQIWLANLNVSRLAPKKQELAQFLQQKAVDAIEQAFAGSETAEPEPTPTPDSFGPAWQQAQAGLDEILSGAQQMVSGAQKLQRAFGTIAHEQAVMLARLAALEQFASAGSQVGSLPKALPAGPDSAVQALQQDGVATRRLLAAGIERIVEQDERIGKQDGRLTHLEKLHQPQPTKKRGRPRKHSS